MTNKRIIEWYEHHEGSVYISFSGGKDSTVLLDLVRKQYPKVPAVFSDTGLEYPEIREFVKTIDNCVWVKPRKNFRQVIDQYGYPVVSKRIARFIHDLQNPTDKNFNVRNLHLTGYNRNGDYCSTMKLPKKWMYLIDAPFKISEKCCHYIKKDPLDQYTKQTGNYPYIGTLTEESSMREKEYLKHGCNTFNSSRPSSQPISFWTNQDILTYLKTNNIPYAKSIYGEIKEIDGILKTTKEQRTGCMFCMFGLQFDEIPNRFQRMKITHPSQYKYCMENLKIKEVLEFIDIPYE